MTQAAPALSPEEIEHFETYGFVVVKNAFPTGPGTKTQRWIDESWEKEGLDPDDKSTWPTKPLVMKRTEEVSVREFAPRAYAAILQLMGGVERVRDPDIRWGNNFLANFSVGHDQPWVPPGPETFEGANWHVDGNWFIHYLDGPEQGILGIVCWDKMVHQGGATFIAPDSIGPVARYLAECPEGVWPDEFPWDDLISQCSDFREVVADAGDFVITHPLMLHRGSQNLKRVPRYMNNSVVSFNEPLQFNRPDGAYSAIERGILKSLGVDSLDFRIRGERRRISKEDRQARRAAKKG